MKRSIRFSLITGFFLVFFMLPAFSITNSEGQKLLQLAQDNSAFYETDFSANYTVVQEKPGEGKTITEAILYRRDKAGKWTILITGPAREKGKGYLQYDDNIWFFDPADRRFTFTSAKDKFQNTNANNSDFTPQHYARDYSIKSMEEVKLGNLDCVLFELTAKVENVTYPILKLWVTKDDGLVRKKEDYSLSGQKLRTTAVPSYQLVKTADRTYSIPVSMLIQDNLRGKKIEGKVQYEKTQITIKNPSFEKVSDTVYTKPYLEMMSSK
ncbi:MAG: outer membrane lipoprotein-sorting protein [Treponema sp.]|nr:outer membrane lipoprotein-sorting protein [Treponema sp.]